MVSNTKDEYPLVLPAIKVSQSFGDFFLVNIKANILLSVTFKDPLRIREKYDDTYEIIGKQRKQKEERLKDIGGYINSVEAAFPNSIILSANFYEKGTSVTNSKIRWIVKKIKGNLYELIIPSDSRIVSIIDGQHRVDAFNYAKAENKEMDLACSVFLDLPETYQAFLFATINYNQKPVPKSLAYELFGASLEKEPKECWSPEKTAIFLTRKLNINEDSPIKGHIHVAPQQDDLLNEEKIAVQEWAVSTATIVDGIMKLYSKNPRKDKVKMHSKTIEDGRNRNVLEYDNTPLRNLFLSSNDLAIYTTIVNYFTAVENILFQKANENSYIKKTVGIQALFDFLKEILSKYFENDKNIKVEYFETFLMKVKDVDFSNSFFQASGIGKSRIKNTLLLANNFLNLSQIRRKEDIKVYKNLLNF